MQGTTDRSWDARDAWSELLFTVDKYFLAAIHANKLHGPQTLRIRCETNVFSLYRGAAEVEMDILDDWMTNGLTFGGGGGVVSPTIDMRGGSDPGNSALTGCGVQVRASETRRLTLLLLGCVVAALASVLQLQGASRG